VKGDVMKKNVGSIDKGIRIVVGIVLAVIGFFSPVSTGWRIALFAVSAVAIVTAFMGF